MIVWSRAVWLADDCVEVVAVERAAQMRCARRDVREISRACPGARDGRRSAPATGLCFSFLYVRLTRAERRDLNDSEHSKFLTPR